jgi:hypothetical protein
VLYQSERWSANQFVYTFTGLPAGSYQVTLKFAEIAYLGPGQRQFNVAINNAQVLTNFDVAAQVGFNTALDETFTTTVDVSGQLAVTFSRGAADNPIVSAIQAVAVASGSQLSFATSPQTLTAGQASSALQVAVPQAPASNALVSLASSSPNGQFATSTAGPWSSTLSVTIPAGQTRSPSFFYRDTTAGSPQLTASATGYTSGTQTETVNPGPLTTIGVAPGAVTLAAGATQLFTSSGADQYGNAVSVAGAAWTTTAPGSVSPANGSTTTFTAGPSTGGGQVTATVGSVSGSAGVTVTAASSTVRINAGGGSYTDNGGNVWSADCCSSGGNTFGTAAAIAGTSDQTLYQTERWYPGTLTYTFGSLPASSYQVTLKFAEIAYLGPGQRQFNVSINGTQVLTNLDVAAQVGLNTALDETFTTTVGANGQLTVAFSKGAADNPIVSAIQAVPTSSSSLSFVSAAQSLTAGQPSAAMQVGLSQAPANNLSVSPASSSTGGQFASSANGPWSSSLTITVPAGQTTSPSFYYKDTRAGSPTLTVGASGYASATQAETVAAGPLASIGVSPASATVATGGAQSFTASGSDQFGNAVSVAGAAWTTTAPGTVSPATGATTTFTAGPAAGSGLVSATVSSISGSATVTVGSATTTIRVNAGGSAYVDSQSNPWSADCCSSSGNVFSTTSTIAGTADQTLYQSERWYTSTFTYAFSGLAAGSYQVALKFAEIAYVGPGQRQFGVSINGSPVLTNFDVAAQAGFNTAVDRTFPATVDASGQLTVAFSKGAADNPIVSAIQVVPG